MVGKRNRTKHILATLVTDKKAPCSFCQRKVDDEITYGKLYAIGDIQCHYFCALLSCCLVQRGKDEEGLFGFLYDDILAEIQRNRKHRCSYCGRRGAGLGCSSRHCRKQFHLPCGRERSAVSLFCGNYKSFCQDHAPKQNIPEHIMAAARLRRRVGQAAGNGKAAGNSGCLKEPGGGGDGNAPSEDPAESVCVICYEAVDGFPSAHTFWPPCCARDAWFHRSCVQRMALSAGVHYLKCPLCNDKENFHEAVVSQGYYVPDRDAAWELEQNAFAEIYERPVACDAEECLCPSGRAHDAEMGMWDIKLCMLCGMAGLHAGCLAASGAPGRHVCAACRPAAPADLEALASSVEALVSAEQSRAPQSARRGPVMPSRMSLRRTKRRTASCNPSTSRSCTANTEKTTIAEQAPSTNTATSRRELNLKTPKKSSHPHTTEPVLTSIENNLLSPLKLLEQSLKERIRSLGVKETEIDPSKVLERARDKFKKPRPLREKKRIVNDLLDNLFECVSKDKLKAKESVLKWNSPKKCDIKRAYTIIEIPTDEDTVSHAKQRQDERITNTLKTKTEDINSSAKVTAEVTEKSEEDEGDATEVEDSCKNNTTAKEIERITDGGEENNKIDATTVMEALERIVDVNNEDYSSNSTFVLPSEFIAERNSDDDMELFETPKKLRTVNIEKDSSLEISEKDAIVNIDVVKMEDNSDSEFMKSVHLKSPIKPSNCAYKFSPIDKETLQMAKVDIDMESFKNQYLNEVVSDFKCEFNHKHNSKGNGPSKLRSALDFALKAYEGETKLETRKRKLPHEDSIPRKRRLKTKQKVVVRCKEMDSIKVVCSQEDSEKQLKETIDLTLESRRKAKNLKLKKKKLSKTRQDIQVKIKWKRERLNLKISKTKRLKNRKKTEAPKNLKQYVLKFPTEATSEDSVIVKPESGITPIKRKTKKHVISPDNLKQTSIQSFFKIISPE